MKYNKFIATVLFTGFSVFLLSSQAYSQALDVDLVSNTHNGGYHISCFGATDGSISSVATGGTAPYSYAWSSGQTTEELSNVGAGSYTLTVTDGAGGTASATIELTQPNKLEVALEPVELAGGTHISANGASDGLISTVTSGGTPPYTYLWNDGSTADKRKYVPAGTYSVTVSDANDCSFSASVTLIEPDPLTVSLNAPMTGGGWNLTCFRSGDGSIDATIAGGVEPYSFDWSHGAFTEDASGLDAGEYTLRVTDANAVTVQASATLTEPTEIDVAVDLLEYPNEHNVSCHNCYNGSATFTTSGGAGSYTYSWEDGNTQASRSDLGLESYRVQVADGNGCIKDKTLELRIPTRDDWTMNGNEIQPQQFIGSTNEEDVEFRAFNQPQLRLGADGTTELLGGVKLSNLPIADGTMQNLVYDPNTNMIGVGGTELYFGGNNLIMNPCDGDGNPIWRNAPGILYANCEPLKVGIGTDDPQYKLDVIGNTRITDAMTARDVFALKVNVGTYDQPTTDQQLYVKGSSTVAEALRVEDENGNARLTIDGDGDVRIKTVSGYSGLEVVEENGEEIVRIRNSAWQPDDRAELQLGDGNSTIAGVNGKGLSFSTYCNTDCINDGQDAMIIRNGRVGINIGWNHTFGAGHLEVNGLIRTREVIVEIENWPDYVFKENYQLRPLSEVEAFINENGHLPEVPSALVVESEGAKLGETDKILLKKIEELTLYVIELEKRLNEQTAK